MILDEAIQSLEDEMEKQTALGHPEHIDNLEQMAEWLKELKAYKEQSGRMTREEADELMQIMKERDDDNGGEPLNAVDRGYHLAYEHLCEEIENFVTEQEPCRDAISRQAVLDCLTATGLKKYDFILNARDKIKALPPVTPQQKMGRWIPIGYDGYADGNPVYDLWECSECGYEHTGDEESLTAFCPNCGTKMEDKK